MLAGLAGPVGTRRADTMLGGLAGPVGTRWSEIDFRRLSAATRQELWLKISRPGGCKVRPILKGLPPVGRTARDGDRINQILVERRL
jgi:hypothetical protein